MNNFIFNLTKKNVTHIHFFFFSTYLAHQLNRRIVVALYNYNAREDTDVSFVKGDRMEVLDDTESDWWRVIVRFYLLRFGNSF